MKRCSLCLVICTTLLLQGCVGAVLVGTTAAVATKAATDPRTVGTQVDDNTLALRVSNAIAKNEQIQKQARIVTTVYQGKVLLTGQAPDPALAEQAKKIAMGVAGVKEVYNEVRKGEPVGLGTASNDTWLTTKVRSALLANDQIKSTRIKVNTENGEVFLLGIVTPQEGQIAARLASKVSGVKRVITAFSYLK